MPATLGTTHHSRCDCVHHGVSRRPRLAAAPSARGAPSHTSIRGGPPTATSTAWRPLGSRRGQPARAAPARARGSRESRPRSAPGRPALPWERRSRLCPRVRRLNGAGEGGMMRLPGWGRGESPAFTASHCRRKKVERNPWNGEWVESATPSAGRRLCSITVVDHGGVKKVAELPGCVPVQDWRHCATLRRAARQADAREPPRSGEAPSTPRAPRRCPVVRHRDVGARARERNCSVQGRGQTSGDGKGQGLIRRETGARNLPR